MPEPTPLLHLITLADWRAALDAGVVTPPSLAEVGFLHLSTPDQVHLPAERLYGGRRDVVLLVVDPRRLTDPVRLEPGVAGDPASMRFPHLYGPLPTSAVVAVVPWRPGVLPALPAPDDALARALALTVSLGTRRATQVLDVPGGWAVVDPDSPLPRAGNRLLLSGPTGADDVEAQAAEVAAVVGWTTPAATLLHADAEPVAAELLRRGWDVAAAHVLARRAPFPATGPGRASSDRVLPVTDLAVRRGGEVVAAAQLRVDGATASLESMVTDPSVRRRGYGNALVDAALEGARTAGCDLVVLSTATDDWPQHWYARRGFTVVGRTWDVVRPA